MGAETFVGGGQSGARRFGGALIGAAGTEAGLGRPSLQCVQFEAHLLVRLCVRILNRAQRFHGPGHGEMRTETKERTLDVADAFHVVVQGAARRQQPLGGALLGVQRRLQVGGDAGAVFQLQTAPLVGRRRFDVFLCTQ